MERRAMLNAYGAELVLTPGAKGMKGAIERAETAHPPDPQRLHAAAVPEPGEIPKFTGETTARGNLGRQRRQGGYCDCRRRHWRHHHRALRKWLKPRQAWPAGDSRRAGKQPRPVRWFFRVPTKIQGIGAGFVPPVLKTELLNEVVTVAG